MTSGFLMLSLAHVTAREAAVGSLCSNLTMLEFNSAKVAGSACWCLHETVGLSHLDRMSARNRVRVPCLA